MIFSADEGDMEAASNFLGTLAGDDVADRLASATVYASDALIRAEIISAVVYGAVRSLRLGSGAFLGHARLHHPHLAMPERKKPSKSRDRSGSLGPCSSSIASLLVGAEYHHGVVVR